MPRSDLEESYRRPARRLLGIVSLDDVMVLLGKEMADAAAAIEAEVEHERAIGVSSKPGKL